MTPDLLFDLATRAGTAGVAPARLPAVVAFSTVYAIGAGVLLYLALAGVPVLALS
jgi:hypothetical protein